MKMGSLSKYFLITISYCLTIIVVRSFGELIVLSDAKTNPSTIELTCKAEDDGAALIWNYNPDSSSLNIEDFQSNRTAIANFDDRAILDSSKCLNKWDETNDWRVVNSATKPTGPVFDHRWEDFQEFSFEGATIYQSYRYVSEIKDSTSILWFSARGLRDLHVYLCERKDPHDGPCLLILISGCGGRKSAVKSWVHDSADPLKDRLHSAWCSSLTGTQGFGEYEHEPGDIIDLYEWRTFRVEWNVPEKTIEVFEGSDSEPFLRGIVPKWHDLSHVLVRSDTSSLIRFHFYDYFFTETKNAVMSTKGIKHSGKIFCAELFIGLCPICKLKINLVDEDDDNIETWDISGDEQDPYNGLLTWQVVRLDTNLSTDGSRILKLKIKSTIDEGMGQWAIDNFRMCASDEELRESKITLKKWDSDRVTCQKLSYTGYSILESFFPHDSDRTEVQSQTLLRTRRERDLDDGAPSEVANLTIVATNTTAVVLTWDRPSGNSTEAVIIYHVQVELIDLKGCLDLNMTTPTHLKQTIVDDNTNETIMSVKNLYPYAKYTASVSERCGSPAKIKFETNPEDVASSKVSKLRISKDKKVIEWNKPENCTTISGSTNTTKLFIRENVTGEQKCQGQTKYGVFPIVTCDITLKPYTNYTVRAHVTRNYSQLLNNDTYQEFTWRTNPAAPSPVRNLTLYDADIDRYTVSLQWLPPDPANGEIIFYVVSLTHRNETFVNGSINNAHWKVEKEVICYEDLKLVMLETKIRVHAVNKDVNETGNSSFIPINWETFSAEPSKPENVTLIANQTLKWKRPKLSRTRIMGYNITVNLVKTDLLDPGITANESVTQFSVTQNEEECVLKLLPSTTYNVSIVSVNQDNRKSSMVSYTNVRAKDRVGFDPEEHLEVKPNGINIRLKVPAVINATLNTWINVTVNGPVTCVKNHSSSPSTPTKKLEWDAARYKVEDGRHKWLDIGANHNHNVMWKCSFHEGKMYEIVVRIEDGDSPPRMWTQRRSTVSLQISDVHHIYPFAVLPVIAACVLILFIWCRKRRAGRMKARELRMSYMDMLPSSSADVSTDPCASECLTAQTRESLYAVTNDPDSCCISLILFEKYARQSAQCGLLTSQFMLLPVGLTRACDYGSLPENMSKNRYENLVAYDETRVILKKIPGDAYSDYINASYIRGYRQERTYIATQGPMPNTVNDFWRMIWQEDVHVICMLTNVVEGSTRLCEEYWPEVRSESRYGDILVSNYYQQIFADYTVRNFKLNYKREIRKVTHLHYTGWPSLGIPMYSQSLVAYLAKLRDVIDGNGPVVVHCHTGDDRTGTIILTDVCLRQADAARVIDVTAAITRMRDDRANMVGTPQHYLLAHILIAESLVYQPRQIHCDKRLPSRIEKMKMQLETNIQRLNNTMWQEQALRTFASLHSSTPEDQVKPFSPTKEPDDISIGAVSVDGVRVKGQYLAAWLPTPLSLHLFWKFVVEKNTKLIIILQCSDPKDPSCCDIIPDESILLHMPRIDVQPVSDPGGDEHFKTDKILLTDNSEENPRLQSVTALTCRGWGAGENGKPPKTKTLVSLWEASQKISRKERETLVLCHDGFTGCGLYLALSFMLERMAVERECDVFSAVRAVRRSRRQFVKTQEEFIYLYDAAVTYAECLTTYSNFS